MKESGLCASTPGAAICPLAPTLPPPPLGVNLGTFRTTTKLPPTQRRQNHNLRPIPHRRGEALGEANALAIDEDVEVGTQLAELGDDAVAKGGLLGPQERQRVGD